MRSILALFVPVTFAIGSLLASASSKSPTTFRISTPSNFSTCLVMSFGSGQSPHPPPHGRHSVLRRQRLLPLPQLPKARFLTYREPQSPASQKAQSNVFEVHRSILDGYAHSIRSFSRIEDDEIRRTVDADPRRTTGRSAQVIETGSICGGRSVSDATAFSFSPEPGECDSIVDEYRPIWNRIEEQY